MLTYWLYLKKYAMTETHDSGQESTKRENKISIRYIAFAALHELPQKCNFRLVLSGENKGNNSVTARETG